MRKGRGHFDIVLVIYHLKTKMRSVEIAFAGTRNKSARVGTKLRPELIRANMWSVDTLCHIWSQLAFNPLLLNRGNDVKILLSVKARLEMFTYRQTFLPHR